MPNLINIDPSYYHGKPVAQMTPAELAAEHKALVAAEWNMRVNHGYSFDSLTYCRLVSRLRDVERRMVAV